MRRLMVGVAALTVAAGTVFADDTSRIAPDEGIWSAEYRDGRNGYLNIDFISADGVGELDLFSKNWLEGRAEVLCDYFFEIDGGTIDQAYIRSGHSNNVSFCPTDISFATARTGADTLKLTLDSAMATQLRLEEIDLQAAYRPLRDEERLVPVEGLNILGLRTGQKRAEAEKILKGAGFALQPNPAIRRYDGFVYSSELWERNANDSDGSSDDIIISWTTKFDHIEDEERILALSRDWKIPQSSRMDQATLIGALSEKYDVDLSTNSVSVTYTRSGDVADRGFCGEGSLETPLFPSANDLQSRARGKIRAFSPKISPYCGQFISISAQSDGYSGMADTLRIDIADSDMVWENFWIEAEYFQKKRCSEILDKLRGATRGAPEL
ncbi:hypothetical protein [Rhodobacter maris]|uniref:Uncharacterized protein n=1 Tax=Rhodobacter maris TaxID=446682 RepID=A0A285S040_9RHOB|nr:hypothetical protein [Rhodobacter maris]SOC00148.1 hypothetical protein SAMN05877831_102295 [Rhodobacter maris]